MNSLVGRLVDNRSHDAWATRLRRRRFSLFESFVAGLPRPLRILDVGGTQRFWETMGITARSPYRIVVLNRATPAVTLPNLEGVAGDATDLSSFSDGAFDVVFSNSVIEHVGDLEAQRRMAAEVRRVGRRYFVQTPNRRFPIEPHFLLPFFQFLPVGVRTALVRRFDLGWYRRIPDRTLARAHVLSHRLLTRREMSVLFPGATIHAEKVFGLTKSVVAYGTSAARDV